jgi:hypothetical protein
VNIKNLFAFRWVEIFKGHDENEVDEVKAALEKAVLSYRIYRFSKESRMGGNVIQTQNSRNFQDAARGAYMSDPGIVLYTVSVRRADEYRARQAISHRGEEAV